jgi:hypothetical protein
VARSKIDDLSIRKNANRKRYLTKGKRRKGQSKSWGKKNMCNVHTSTLSIKLYVGGFYLPLCLPNSRLGLPISLGVVVVVYNLSLWDAEAEGWQVWGQPGLLVNSRPV